MPEILGDPETLAAAIRRSAQQESLHQEAEAQRRAARVVEQAHEEARRIREAAVTRARKEAEEERRRILSRATLEAQRRHLQARETLLERVWGEAERMLWLLPDDPEYAGVLARLARMAAGALGPGPVTLAADPAGHELLTPERLAAWEQETGVPWRRAAAPVPAWGGVIATDESGHREVEATFSTRLALAREELRQAVAVLLEET